MKFKKLVRTIGAPIGIIGERVVQKNRVAQIHQMSSNYSGKKAVTYWQSVPAGYDGGGQIRTTQLFDLNDTELLSFHQEQLNYRHNTNWEKVVVNWLRLYVNSSSVVLDFGCGLGHSGWDVYHTLGGQIIFADIISDNLAYADRLITLQNANASTLLLPVEGGDWQSPQPIDVTLALGVLHHIPNPSQVVNNIWQEMKPGGVIALLLYNAQHFRHRFALSLKTYANRSETLPGNPYTDFFNRERTETLMQGFRLLKYDQDKDPGFDLFLFERV